MQRVRNRIYYFNICRRAEAHNVVPVQVVPCFGGNPFHQRQLGKEKRAEPTGAYFIKHSNCKNSVFSEEVYDIGFPIF